jgi:serine protease Do
MPMPRTRLVLAAALLLAMLAPGAPAVAAETRSLWTDSPPPAVPADIARLNDYMHGLSERVKPALVQIRVRRAVEASADKPQDPREAPPKDGPDEPRRTTGSGFVIREDGYVVTNQHVVENAEQIQVMLSNGRRFAGKVVGADERVDLALVKIDATGLPVAPLGDSNRVRVGEFVLALGHPFGLEQTVSFGIVSRRGAPLEVAAPGYDYVQTDAAVNPGNSGGPLVNMAGEVIGVNAMAARNGSIGFAIPVNLVKMLLPQLAELGRVRWGWVGVSITEVSEEDLPRYGLKEQRGVIVRQVVPGQPAEQAGLRIDDLVLALDGAQLEGPRDLQRIISSTPVGQTIKVLVRRGGKDTEIPLVVGEYQNARRGRP